MLAVWPSDEAADDALATELASGEARAAGVTFRDLCPPAPRAFDPVAARLALRAACAPEGPAGRTRGYLRAAARFVAHAERAGLEPGDLRGAPGPLARIFARVPRLPSPDRLRGDALARPRVPAEDIVVKPRLVWEPADVELVLAVARRTRVTVELWWGAGRPALFDGMERVVRAFEAHPEIEGLELRFADLDDGLAGALFRGALPPPRPEEEPPVELLVAPTPDAELRAIAARARREVDAGTPPEQIAVAMRAPRAARLAEELARAGLLLDDRSGPPVLSAPVARLVLDVVLLPDRRFAREDVLAVIGSRYVDFPGADRVRAEARARGTPRLELPGLAGLPDDGTLAEHAAALARSLADLRVGERARAGAGDGDEIDRAVARDRAAMDAVDATLARLGCRGERVPRAAFAAILADLLGETALPALRLRGGALKLVALEDLAARTFDVLFLPGLVETPPATEGVYGDRERRALNQHLGRRAFPDDEERRPFDNLLFTHAVAAAQKVVLSHATSDGERAIERAPFVDEVLRAAPWLPATTVPRAPVWPLAHASAPRDVLARAALERWADPAGRLPEPRAATSAAAVPAGLYPRLARVEALAAIERARWRYFAGDEPANPYVGLVAGRPAGTVDAPLAAKQLELLANCPWTYFAARVLGVDPPAETDDAAPAQTVGALAHRILEMFYRRRAEARALPVRGTNDDRATLAAACAVVFAAEGPRGHHGLWEVLREKLYEDLWRLVRAAPPWDGVPTAFELPFRLALGDVHVAGRMDRVDRAIDGAVVVDYKLGALSTQRARLRDETRLQLPVYALAAQSIYGGRAAAAYASVRDGAYTRTLGPEDIAEVPAQVAALAARVREGRLEVAPVDCRGCRYRTACRVVILAEREDW